MFDLPNNSKSCIYYRMYAFQACILYNIQCTCLKFTLYNMYAGVIFYYCMMILL